MVTLNAPHQTVNDLVRFDNRLTPMARLFYAEVCANITSTHGAIVNDEYYAQLWNVSTRQVRTWRKELVDFDYTYEKIDTVIGLKCIFPTKTVEEQILANVGLKKPKILNLTYTTNDGRILHNVEEAKFYYQAIIHTNPVPEEKMIRLSYFMNIFCECAFDDVYFGKIYGKQKITKEFFDFVFKVLTIEEIYTKAQYVFDKEKFADIRQPDYYILTIISNLYKDQFNSKCLKASQKR